MSTAIDVARLGVPIQEDCSDQRRHFRFTDSHVAMVVLHRVAASPLSIIRRLASKQRTHYETLGVRQSATASEIRSAFLELSKKHHPDKQGNVEVFKAVNEAYSVLSREEFRRTYDRSLAAGEPVVHDEPIFRRAHDVYREDYYSAHQFPFGR
ncbi:hypothetical protein T265_06100 [Opisthorchis viverrini]|uniref:J domain-containing protein n=1 Tax=Opisthorchis viverrini TaxID=6198 RepID=A0A075AEI1_OPIVI|nr:hypothetical protein T265_06100 [Opisthorchis viverrini]KER26739.1 hypothetical protein T265_06100 [Opisthorchis viverrini]